MSEVEFAKAAQREVERLEHERYRAPEPRRPARRARAVQERAPTERTLVLRWRAAS